MSRIVSIALCVFSIGLAAGSSNAWALDGAPVEAKVTAAEAETLARKIAVFIAKGDPTELARAIDDQAVLDRALEGITVSEDDRTGLLSSVKVSQMLPSKIVETSRKDAGYHFLRVLDPRGNPRPLFRLIGKDGLNYHEYELKRINGQVRIIDVDVYVTGEMLSKTLRRGLLPVFVEKNRGIFSKLVGSESDYMKNFPKISQIQQDIAVRKFTEALRAYDSLPASVQRDKTLMVLRVAAAAHADHETYLKAIDDFEKAYPGDRAELLLSLDGLYLHHDYDELDRHLDQLDQALGGDLYLDLYRANSRISQGKSDEARPYLRRLTTGEPRLRQPWFAWIDLSLKEKKFDETARLLNESSKRAGLNWSNVKTAPGFAEFVASPEYSKWDGSHSAPASPPR